MGAPLLILADDRARGAALAAVLTQAGFAADYQPADAALPSRDFAGVIIDIQAPDASPYQTCQSLRADGLVLNTPILLLTNVGSEAETRKARAMGANAILARPYLIRDLTAHITKMLEGADAC